MLNNIHPLSDVLSDKIGINTYIWQYTVVLKDAKIGDNCNVNCNCFLENDVIIGDNVTIKSGVQIWDGLRIEDDVFVGPNVTFTNDLVPRSKVYPKEFKKTFLRKGCSLGANATIVAGIEIGKYALVGAGSVLTKSINPYTVWYGNPATHKGYISEDLILLDLDLIDKKTGKQYYLVDFKPKQND
jgi:UDP-2-acetamido-3-amino-2,3-dideoxy-glucuronate N-acetyltransferase